MLDLLAREEAEEARAANRTSLVGAGRAAKAVEIRRDLVATLPELTKTQAWLQNEWWFYATLAEAQLGLGDFDAAVKTLREYNHARGLGHEGPPLHAVDPANVGAVVPRWEFESTLTQLATLARLQGDSVEHGAQQTEGVAWKTGSHDALRSYPGTYAPALDRAEPRQVGLSLSGGGFRASFFHSA